jgi:hypothetical protein
VPEFNRPDLREIIRRPTASSTGFGPISPSWKLCGSGTRRAVFRKYRDMIQATENGLVYGLPVSLPLLQPWESGNSRVVAQ